jgi:hypothetical protein
MHAYRKVDTEENEHTQKYEKKNQVNHKRMNMHENIKVKPITCVVEVPCNAGGFERETSRQSGPGSCQQWGIGNVLVLGCTVLASCVTHSAALHTN